jgi:hypothetical protein
MKDIDEIVDRAIDAWYVQVESLTFLQKSR